MMELAIVDLRLPISKLNETQNEPIGNRKCDDDYDL
jgi:hypothetical protein